MGIDEQGKAYINAKEEDLATFSILDNPYSLYWGSSSDTGDTGYSYKPITSSINITKGKAVESLELKKLNKITYKFFNDRNQENGAYNLYIKITGFDKYIKIQENNVTELFFDISKHLENYLCIDVDNLKTFNLYLYHMNDNVYSKILFDASQVQNWDTAPEFYFDADSLLYIEPFVTAKFDEYIEYYKGEPVYKETYKYLRTGFNTHDRHEVMQVIPDDAEDSQYVQTYEFDIPNAYDEVVVKKFANLSAIDMKRYDCSNCTIHLADNKNTNLIIYNFNQGYKPPNYENVANTGDISLSIINYNTNVVNFAMFDGYGESETTLYIQQTVSDGGNRLENKIKSLSLTSDNLTSISGGMLLEYLTLAIKNELPEYAQSIIAYNLKELDLSDSKFKNIPGNFFPSYKLETLILNDTIESIGDNAFSELSNLNNIVLPKKLKKIGSFGLGNIGRLGNITSLDFRDTQLETLDMSSLVSEASLKIYLPTTVTNIADFTFGPYTTVYYNGTATGAPWGAKEVITEF